MCCQQPWMEQGSVEQSHLEMHAYFYLSVTGCARSSLLPVGSSPGAANGAALWLCHFIGVCNCSLKDVVNRTKGQAADGEENLCKSHLLKLKYLECMIHGFLPLQSTGSE